MKWVKDQKVEANLRRLGIKFEVETGIPLSSIDREEGLRRQVRLIAKLKEDVVLRYGLAMEDPEAAFPMPILQKEKHGKGFRYWPTSGNHRLAAADIAEVSLVDAYVVQVYDVVMLDLLLRQVNLWEAPIGQSREEAIINARYMIETHGITVEDAARMFGLKKEAIYKENRIAEVEKMLPELGIAANGFPKALLNRLHTIADNINVLKETARFIHRHKLRGVEALSLVSDVQKGQTEHQAIAELARWEKVLLDRDKPKKDKSDVPYTEVNRKRFFTLLTGLDRFLENNRTLTQAQITDAAHMEVAKRRWKSIQVGMTALLGGN